MGDHARQQQQIGQIDRCQHHQPFRARRFEAGCRYHGPFDFGQGAAYRIGQLQGARGRLHPAVDPNEQRIVEQVAQPTQRLAQGRLAKADAGTGTGYVAFGDQGVESDKQVEVDGVQDRHNNSI
jgi:hypothetical protein